MSTAIAAAATLPTLHLGTPENVVYPEHPRFEGEKVRVGFIVKQRTWVLVSPPDALSKDFRHLGACSDEHITDLETLNDAGLIECECDGPPGSYVIRLPEAAE